MPLDLTHIPVVDHHCHPWLHPGAAYEPETYRRLFTEGVHPGIHAQVPHTIYYRWTIRELARLLECEPTEDDVLATRAGMGHDAFAARLMAEANVESAILDHLFSGRGADNFSVAQMGPQLGGARTYAAVRLESVLAELVAESDDAEEAEAKFRHRLNRDAFAAEGTVSLKSIAAYRTGLAIEDPSRGDAYARFAALKTEARANGSVRIADKVYLDYHLMIALRWCAAEKFPIQFHSGYGDPDVDLRTGNPDPDAPGVAERGIARCADRLSPRRLPVRAGAEPPRWRLSERVPRSGVGDSVCRDRLRRDRAPVACAGAGVPGAVVVGRVLGAGALLVRGGPRASIAWA